MGEAFKRKRAAAFEHQRSRYYQALLERDLFRIARATDRRVQVNGQLSNTTTEFSIGCACLVRENGGEYDVVHGNVVVAHLPREANDAVSAFSANAPSLNGILPCRVTRLSSLGGFSLELDPGENDDSQR